MTLARLQGDFMARLLEEELPLPSGWDDRMAQGLDIYRNAYRARLVDALRETYPKTSAWIGDEAFHAAAAHHLIMHPPSGWTLDAAGAGFAQTLDELFTKDPEVPELAWLEWAMHCAFVASDAPPLDHAEFARATSGFAENDWATMRIGFLPGMQQKAVGTPIANLWHTIGEGGQAGASAGQRLGKPMHCLVWRDAFTPAFCLVGKDEGNALARMRAGVAYGEVCGQLAQAMGEDAAVTKCGAMLGHWLSLGIVSEVQSGRGGG